MLIAAKVLLLFFALCVASTVGKPTIGNGEGTFLVLVSLVTGLVAVFL